MIIQLLLKFELKIHLNYINQHFYISLIFSVLLFVLFHFWLFIVQCLVCDCRCFGGQRNRCATNGDAFHIATCYSCDVASIHYRKQGQRTCAILVHFSAHIAHHYATTIANGRANDRTNRFDACANSHIYLCGLHCFQSVPYRSVDVWQEIELERDVEMGENLNHA